MQKRLDGKRVLITQSTEYMGPDAIEVFKEHGAEIIADDSDLRDPEAAARIVKDAGHIDVLVANLAAPPDLGLSAVDTSDETWAEKFDIMVHPLHRLCRAVLPQMYERKAGKVVVFGSGSGIKGFETLSSYSAARAAQVGYVRVAGMEAARHNVQINLIAQIWVENPAYFPPEFTETPEFQAMLAANVPLGRLATGREDAMFALFLASDESNFFVGQSIPFSGGWAQ